MSPARVQSVGQFSVSSPHMRGLRGLRRPSIHGGNRVAPRGRSIMSTADTSGTRQAAIATFDATRDDFLAAFAEAPDGALTYLPPGDEYTLGVLPRHLCDSMDGYLDTLDQIERA